MATVSFTNAGDVSTNIRPSEAQLRWAQFHHKRRAHGVNLSCQRLYQTPQNLQDVPGAYPEDGNSTTSISEAEIRERRPKVSRGRRAYLRVSKRNHIKRIEVIRNHGFRRLQGAETFSDGEEEDDLNDIFMAKRRRPRRRGEEKDERVKRFEAACHAMMMNLAQPEEQFIVIPDKRWTRNADHIAASAALDDEYLDPKWGIRRRILSETQEGTDNQFNLHHPAVMPFDRGASWLVHMPNAIPPSRDNPSTNYYVSDPSRLPHGSVISDGVSEGGQTVSTLAMRAPGQQKFNQLVALAQQRLIERGVDEQKYYQAERRSKDRSAEFNSGSPVGENRNKAQLRFETSPTKPKKSYMPRMRLRDFMPNAEEKEFEGSDDEMNLEELRALNQIPRDKYLEALQREKETGRRLSRTQEMAHSLEAEKERNMVSRTKEIARSYEGSKHPKMRLRDFDELGMEAGAHDLVEEEELHPEELVVMNNIVGMHLRKFDIASFEDRSKSLDKADHIVQKFEADEKENHVSRIRQLFYSMNGDETNSEDPGNKPMQLGDFMAVQQIIRARIEQFEIGGNIEQKRRLTRAREMALAFEANTKTGRETKARQLASSFEKPQTRKMQLKNLDFRQNDQNSSARDDMELQPEELVVMQQGIHSRLEKEFEQKTDAEIQEILSRAKEVAEVFEGGSMEETRTTMREMFDILEGEGQEHDRQDEKLQPEEVIVLQNMIHTCIEEIETDGDVEKCGRLTRAKLIAQVFESTSKEQKNGRIRQMVKSLQRDQASGMRTKKLSSGHGGTVTTAYQNSRRRLSEPPRAFDFQTKRESRHSAPCCARCARPSPLVLSSGANSMQAPARTTPRESDFFERIRQNNATSGNMQGYEQDQSRVIDFDKAQQTGPFKRESGYFKQVRQVNSNPMNSTKPNLDLPSNRGSDVFEKVRQMNSEKANRSVSTEEISIDPNLEPHLCDECQAEEFKEEEVDGEGSSSVSRINRGDEVEVVSTTDFSAPKEDRISDTSYSNDPDSRVRFSSQSNISRDSAINDLWNRGRSSLNTLASTLNQQSSAAPLPTHLKETAVSVSERVNHFFQSSPPESNQQSSVLPPSGNLVGSVSVSERVNSFFQNSTSGSNQQPGESPVPGNLKGAAVDVSERVGSFFQIIRNKDESDDADQQSRNELHEFPPSKSIYRNQDDVGGKDQPTLPFRSREQNEVPDTSVVSTPKRRSNGENDSDVGQPVPPQRSKVEQELYDAMQASTPKRNKEEQYAPDEFDADFLAAYRKKRESITPVADDASSASSFQALPSGFREVVKQYSPSRKSHRPSPARKSQGIESPRKPKSSDLSTENVRNFSERSLPPDNFNQGIIDTDGTTSEASNYGMNPSLLSSLMLSPDLLTKRHQQAVRAIERKQWDDVNYLVNANPWLAEMSELTTKQYLLHKIAFFGAGSTPAPLDLCQQLMAKFPAAVHKFDEDGNVPLHLAAAAGHMKMITMLGDEFESGASIRNEDGMLPLHFTIASYGQLGFATNDKANGDGNKYENAGPLPVIKTVLKFFPQAVAIGDNDGNLPLHIAVECLEGRIALDVIYLLLDEADRQLQDPYGARFYNKLRFEEILSDGMSSVPPTADIETDESMMDPDTHCNMVRNNLGESPLLSAIHARKGWQIIETLVSGPGGRQAALYQGAKQNNALHLLVTEFQDPTAALSVLKNAPETSTMRNSDGMLPIEVRCVTFGGSGSILNSFCAHFHSLIPLLGGLHAVDAGRSYPCYCIVRSTHRHH